MGVEPHKGFHPHCLHTEQAEEEEVGLAVSGVQRRKRWRRWEAREAGTVGMTLYNLSFFASSFL